MDPASAFHGPLERPTGFDVECAWAGGPAAREWCADRMDVVLLHVRLDVRQGVTDELDAVAFIDARAGRENGLLANSPRAALVMLSGYRRRSVRLARR